MKCANCGKKITFIRSLELTGVCEECFAKQQKAEQEAGKKKQEAKKAEQETKKRLQEAAE